MPSTRKNRNRRLGLALVASLAVTLAACSGGSSAETSGSATPVDSQTEASSPIKIGVLLPLSGDGASYGEDNRAGAEIALEMFNEAGGIDGVPVELEFVDVTTPDQAQTEAQRLISERGVNVLSGTAFSSLAVPASAVAERNGKVYWELSAASDEVTNRGFTKTFQLNAYASTLGSAGVEYVAKVLAPMLGKSVSELKTAVIYTDDAFGAALGESMAAEAENQGMQLLLTEAYNSTATDLSPLILKLKGLEPDVLFASTQERDAILLYQQSKELDFYVPVFADSVGFDNPSTAEALGASINGAFATTAPVHTAINVEGLTPEGQELLASYADRFKAKTGRPASSDSDLAFGGMWVLLNNVLGETKSDDPDLVAQAARSLDLPIGSLPNGYGVQFDANGHNTRAFAVVEQWQDGKLVVVGPEGLGKGEPIDVPLPPWSERG